MGKRKACDEITDLARRQAEASFALERAIVKHIIDTKAGATELIIKTLRAHGYSVDASVLEEKGAVPMVRPIGHRRKSFVWTASALTHMQRWQRKQKKMKTRTGFLRSTSSSSTSPSRCWSNGLRSWSPSVYQKPTFAQRRVRQARSPR